MNKAFTRDDEAGEAPWVPPRAPLPEGVPNYVTPRGLELLREEMARLDEERARAAGIADEAERRRAFAVLNAITAQLAPRIASAQVVEPAARCEGTVRFGCEVRVRDAQGDDRTLRIVGVDEADPANGLVAFTSPIARALIGRSEGDVATVRTPRGDDELEVLEVRS